MKVLIALVLALPAYAAQPELAVDTLKPQPIVEAKRQSACSCKCVTGGSFNNLSPEQQMRMIRAIMEEAPMEPSPEMRLD